MAKEKSAASRAKVAYTPVLGWASGEWTQEAAVVVNPDATPIQLLSWAIGQLEQTAFLMEVIGCMRDDGMTYDLSDVVGAIRHPTEQAVAVLRAAADQMFHSGAR